MRTTHGQVLTLGVRALVAAGVPADAARLQMSVLLEADLRGQSSHGLMRLPRILERIAAGLTDPVATGDHDWTSEALLDVDGQDGLGAVVAARAFDEISERAESTGIACAAIHSSNHLGMLGWYVERVARRGQVGVAMTTSEALVHPWGGRFATHGTNPLAIAVPSVPDPLVLDMSTGLVSMGKVHDYANRGLPLEPGWVLDHRGRPTTDPVAGMQGSIAPFGGPKGYALGLALEVLVGSLTASALGTAVQGTLDSVSRCNKGDVLIVLRGPSAPYLNQITSFLEDVRQTAPSDLQMPVLVPGDGARRRRTVSMSDGFEVADSVWAAVIASVPGRRAGQEVGHEGHV